MQKNVSVLSLFLCITLLLCGCNPPTSVSGGDENAASSGNTVSVDTDFAQNSADLFTDRDYEIGYDEEQSVHIRLNGDSASSNSDSVQISGTVITITEEATYVVSGTLNDGMLIINAPDTAKPHLVFDGVDITSATSAPLYILESDKVFLTLATDTENTLSNGGNFTAIDENNIDAAIFSKQDLTLNGNGSLTVVSPAGHGIVSKDDLVITGGTYHITSASHGLNANDSVRIANASLTADAGKDGIHAENNDDNALGFVYIASGTLYLNAGYDGISAGAHMQLESGTYEIVSGGGADAAASDSESFKGIKSTDSILINGGDFKIDSADDAIHSNTSVIVNGGTFEIATGDDAFHADQTLTVTNGTVNITKSYEGLEALDIVVSGGDIKLVASDDGLNAAGGADSSGFGGFRGDDGFGGGMGRPGGGDPGGGMGGGGMSSGNGSITVSGGTLYINASGDGIDANGTLSITGGHTTVCGPTRGDTATLDYDKSAVISGGTFIGTGASGMAQTFSDSEQGVIALSVGNQSAGTEISLKDAEGNMVLSYIPALDFAVVIISSPELQKGETYTVAVGSSSGEFEAD